MKARFRGLLMVARLSKGLGWLSLIAGLVLGALTANGTYYLPILLPAGPYSTQSLVGALLTFLPFLFWFLFMYAAGGAIQVLIAIERNTRPVAPGLPEERPGPIEEPGDGDYPETPITQ